MWQPELTLILRHLIDDLCGTDYSDERLEEVILVSAQLLLGESQFEQDYTVNVVTATLSPDPTEINDDMFMSLLVMKAACILARGALRAAAAREGIKVTDKMGSIEIKGKYAAAQELATSYCDYYHKAKLEYSLNNTNNVRAIFNVVVGPNINIEVPWIRPREKYPDSFFN